MSGSENGRGLKCAAGVVVAGARDADVLGDGGLAFSLELQGQDVLEDLEFDTDQPQHRGQGDRVLDQVASDLRRQLLDRERTELHAVGGCHPA